MKLIGSRTEQDFREILVKSHKSLFEEHFDERLLSVLCTSFPNMRTAYIIGHIPEQGEDLYTILINANIVAKIEIDRYNRDITPIVDTITIQSFVQGRSKLEQIKLEVAMDLAKKDLDDNERS